MLRAIIFLLVFSNFWVPPGSQKTTQNRHFPKKAVPGSALSSIFAANTVFLDSSVDFGSISVQKSMFFVASSLHFSRAFLDAANPCFHWQAWYESNIFIFWNFRFFRKKREKTSENWACQKSRKNSLPGDPKWTQN